MKSAVEPSVQSTAVEPAVEPAVENTVEPTVDFRTTVHEMDIEVPSYSRTYCRTYCRTCGTDACSARGAPANFPEVPSSLEESSVSSRERLSEKLCALPDG